MKDTLETLAHLIQRQRRTQGERCHLLITPHTNADDVVDGYRVLCALLREGYFSTIVTMNTNTELERILEQGGLPPSAYQVLVFGRDSDEKVAIALDGQESGICIIKLLLQEDRPLTSEVWESLLGYLRENIVVVGCLNEKLKDIIHALSEDRDRNSIYYTVPMESCVETLLGHMRRRQRQYEHFLICGSNGAFVNFFRGLGRLLLHDNLLLPDDATVIGKRDGPDGEASGTMKSSVSDMPVRDWAALEDGTSVSRPPPAVPPRKQSEMIRQPQAGDQRRSDHQFRNSSGPLENLIDQLELSEEDQLIKSGPLELDSPLYYEKEAIRRLPWPAGVDVLLVTATTIELQAFLTLRPERVRRTLGKKTYFDLGRIGRVRTVVVQANNMGSIEALVTVDDGIRALSPCAVIMVGIAFGLRPKDQKIGDILVSRLIHDYDSERIGTDENDQLASYQRGPRVTASDWLLDRFNAGNHEWTSSVKIHFGTILSGSKLVDNEAYQKALVRSAPEAIGGEMEGVGFLSAANRHGVPWLLVKGISDWANGTKSLNKVDNNKLAAENAARFVLFVIGQEDFMHTS